MQSPAMSHGNIAFHPSTAPRSTDAESRQENASRRRTRGHSYLHGYATDHATRRRLPRFRVR